MSEVNIKQLISVTNVVELTKATIAKIGLEHAAPLEPAVLEEKIMKAIGNNVKANEE